MGTQISMFDGANKYVNDKPIRLIECFAGYGSQALALKYLGIPFEHHRIAEWAVKSIQAYKDMHFPDDYTDYSCGLTSDNVVDYLFERGISADYNKPMTREQVKRMDDNFIYDCECLCMLEGGKWDNLLDANRRVYSTEKSKSNYNNVWRRSKRG